MFEFVAREDFSYWSCQFIIKLRSSWLSVISCDSYSLYSRNSNRFSTALPIRRLVGGAANRYQLVVYKRHACFIAPLLPMWISVAIMFVSLGRTCTKARRTRQFPAGTCYSSIFECRAARVACCRCRGVRGVVTRRGRRGWLMIHVTSRYCWCCQLYECYRTPAELRHTCNCIAILHSYQRSF